MTAASHVCSTYEEQLRYLKQLKSQGADKATLRAAATKLRQFKLKSRQENASKARYNQKAISYNANMFLDVYRSHFRTVPYDKEGFSVSFPVPTDEVGASEVRKFFQEFGFAIFRDVIDAEECVKTQDEIWSYLESNTAGFERFVPETYCHLSSQTYGLAPEPAIFTPQIVKNRCCVKVLRAFRTLIQDDDILVSHDRWCVYRPTRDILFKNGVRSMPQWKTRENLHLDLNPWTYFSEIKPLEDLRYDNLRDFSKEINGVTLASGPHVQGVLSLHDNKPNDGGTVLLVGFHKCFKEWRNSLGSMSDQIHSIGGDLGHLVWRGNGVGSYILAPSDPLHKFKQRVTTRAGSLLIWNQCVLHGSAHNDSDKFRVAQFIKAFRRAPIGEIRLSRRMKRVDAELKRNGVHLDAKMLTAMKRAIGLT